MFLPYLKKRDERNEDFFYKASSSLLNTLLLFCKYKNTLFLHKRGLHNEINSNITNKQSGRFGIGQNVSKFTNK